MNAFINGTHNAIRKKVRGFAEKKIKPSIGDFEAREEFPVDLIRSMDELDLFGMQAPEKYGGQNSDYLSFIIAVEELARIDSSVAATLLLRYEYYWQKKECSLNIRNYTE